MVSKLLSRLSLVMTEIVAFAIGKLPHVCDDLFRPIRTWAECSSWSERHRGWKWCSAVQQNESGEPLLSVSHLFCFLSSIQYHLHPHERQTPNLIPGLKCDVTRNLSVHHMATSLKADALNGLQLVNYSSLGLLYPRWCSVSPLVDKRE